MTSNLPIPEQRKYRGKVGVSSSRGSLRITIPKAISGKPGSYLNLGLKDTEENRKIALAKAALLSSDILYERVDPTLERYRVLKLEPLITPPETSQVVSLTSLYSDYIETKKENARPGTYKNGYLVTLSHIKKSPCADDAVDSKDTSYSQKIADWAGLSLTKDAGKRLMVQLHACFKWAIKSGRLKAITKSPFEGIDAQFVAKQRKTDENWSQLAFSSEERDRILDYFKQDSKSLPYYGYTAFSFYTGARPGEVIALTWDDISPGMTHIEFNKEIVNGVGGAISVKGLKTEEKRIFPINQQLKEILVEQRAKQNNGNSNLVFTSISGCPINPSGYFRPKIWKPALAALNIPYRKPYSTRHTFITHCLEAGMPVKDLSRLVGNSPNIIYKHYAGVNVRTLIVPQL
jgi:integrase